MSRDWAIALQSGQQERNSSNEKEREKGGKEGGKEGKKERKGRKERREGGRKEGKERKRKSSGGLETKQEKEVTESLASSLTSYEVSSACRIPQPTGFCRSCRSVVSEEGGCVIDCSPRTL